MTGSEQRIRCLHAKETVPEGAWRGHHLKHPINETHMEVHMLIEAGAETVDKLRYSVTATVSPLACSLPEA